MIKKLLHFSCDFITVNIVNNKLILNIAKDYLKHVLSVL